MSLSGPYLCPSNICFNRTPQPIEAIDANPAVRVTQTPMADPRSIKLGFEDTASSQSISNEIHGVDAHLSVISAKIDKLEVLLKESLEKLVERDPPTATLSKHPSQKHTKTHHVEPTKHKAMGDPPFSKLKASTKAKVLAVGRFRLMTKRASERRDGDETSQQSPIPEHPDFDSEARDTVFGSEGENARRRSIASSVGSFFRAEQHHSKTSERTQRVRETIRANRRDTSLCAKINIFMEKPTSSTGAYIFSRLMNAILVCTIVISLLQTFDSNDGIFLGPEGLEGTIFTLESAFAIELLMRFLALRDTRTFLNVFNMIDLVAVLIFAMRAMLRPRDNMDSDTYKTLRSVVPLVYSLKLMRRQEKLQLLVTAFQVALDALPVLLYTMGLIVIVFADLMYLVERDNMNDLPTAVWFTTVTISTVGYGDMYPETWWGRCVTMVLIYVSALYMAIPIGIVGNAFSEVWADRDRLLVKQRFRAAFIQEGFTTKTMQEIFTACDADESGEIDVEEFVVMLQLMEIGMPVERMRMLFVQLDKQGEGRITLEDLIEIFAPYHFVRSFWYRSRSALSMSASTDVLQS